MPEYLREKRNELIWALSLQDYSLSDIGKIFNIHRATIMDVVKKKPKEWRPKWTKTQG